jgi:hypothetical protein
MMMILLNESEALQVVISFLRQHYEKTKPDDSGILANELNEIKIGTNKYTIIQKDWIESLKQIQRSSSHTQDSMTLTEEMAFEAMYLFLEKYYARTKSDDIGLLLSTLLHGPYGATADPAAWQIWQECLGKVKNQSR